MIPFNYELQKYDQLPWLSQQQLSQHVKMQRKLVFYNDLVVDLTDFQHPANIKIIEPFINNFQANIEGSFASSNHSEYAQMILCIKTIGKTNKNNKNQTSQINTTSTLQNCSKGRQLFQKIQNSQRFNLYKKTISKIKFQKPIFDQLDQLSAQQKIILTEIPTDLENAGTIKFKQKWWHQLWYTSNFWISTIFFQLLILKYFYYFYNLHNKSIYANDDSIEGAVVQTQKLNFMFLIFCVFVGLIKWSIIEYYFHRFLLHWDIKIKPLIGDHLMHHAFPKIKNKLALSISRVIMYFIVFNFVYSYILRQETKTALMFGVLIGLTLYDILHYYFHFGPEINIGWLVKLKRNHLKHHYRNQQKGFGVTNTFWDHIFGTSYEKSK